MFWKSLASTRLQTECSNRGDKFEVVVVGAGPAGLFLTLQLARYGLSEDSLLCIDAKEEYTKTGHADGITGRTLEILRTFGLEGDILRDGYRFNGFTIWAKSTTDPTRIECTQRHRHTGGPQRYGFATTFHQGRLERLLKNDLRRYHPRGVDYSTSLVALQLDEATDPEYPVLATLEHNGQTRRVRTKYLVGADGARSVVRNLLHIDLEGEMTDQIWGVVDFICDTDFPDVRRPCSFENEDETQGAAFLIPRERMSNGEYTTRIYVNMTNHKDGARPVNGVAFAAEPQEREGVNAVKKARAAITPQQVLDAAAHVMSQYHFKMKEGTQPLWWAAYGIGQRLAKRFTQLDSKGSIRILLMGDGKADTRTKSRCILTTPQHATLTLLHKAKG